MNIVVCVKGGVPELADAEIELTSGGADVEREDLVMVMGEWDAYAVEEAVRLKEAHGGHVTALSLGDDEDGEAVLRRALAMGCDAAVRVDDEDFEGSDALGIARGLHAALGGRAVDLVLAGAQSADTGWGQVGITLAGLMGVPFAALAVGIAVEGERLRVERELEANTLEVVTLPRPALVTVQTGINQPRYVSVMGIRKVRKVAIEVLDADALGLDEAAIGRAASCVGARRLALPTAGGAAEMLAGPLDAATERVAAILRERLGVA